MTDQEGSVAIVTGGAQGIGAAICLALLDKGFKVCVADILENEGKSYVKELRGKYGDDKAIFSYCNVTKEDHYKSTFDAIVKAFGKVDLLVNNAGIVAELEPLRTLEVNLMGPINGCQTAFKYMGKSNGGKGGMVINTASILGFAAMPVVPTYTATKHGVVGLTRSYGHPKHFERDGITFAAIAPSFTRTNISKKSSTLKLGPVPDVTNHPNIMSPDYVAEGAMKVLEDRINGSVMLISKKGGFQYIGYQEEVKDRMGDFM